MPEEEITWPAEYQNLPDDFANDKDIQAYRKQLKDFEEMMEKCFEAIKSACNLSEIKDAGPGDFYLLKSLEEINVLHSFGGNTTNLPLTAFVVSYSDSYQAGRHVASQTDQYLFGLLVLRKEYPYSMVTPETMAKKIADLFIHTDLNFEDAKKFSSCYFVQTNDKDKLKMLLANKWLDELTTLKEFEIEINKNQCLFRVNREKVNPQVTEQFCEAAKLLNKVLNG